MTVPAQFMGMAHAFLYSIENLIPHGDLARSLAKTLARGNQIRPEQMAQMAAILSRPYPGTLHCEIAWNRQKTRVQIGAVRAVRSCLALTQWSPGHPVRDLTVANSEHVCDLYYLQTSISKKQMTNRVELLATVGEHAL